MKMLRLLVILALALPRMAEAQPGRSMTVPRFVAEARAATQRYQRQEVALADGYKRVGVEFPAMGEHWVSLQRVMEDTLLPSRPAVLIYTTVRGKPHLAGVGYTALLDPGEPPPDWAPATGYWHEHNGSVAEESLPALHGASHQPHRGSVGGVPPIRLAILHAWVWTANPAGVFETDNWALPPMRAGARAGARHPRETLRGMALATDDEGYYLQTITARLALTGADQARAARVLEVHRARAQGALRAGGAGKTVAESWRTLWRELARVLPAKAATLKALEREL